MIKIIQSWFHFEDKINPSEGRVIRQVVDFYTNDQFISLSIDLAFVKCKIRSRYKGNELEFIQEGNNFKINLGDLNEWPISNNKSFLRHVKIEIEYTDIIPMFEKRSKHNIFKTGYSSTCEITELGQPEFYLTVPLGMKIKYKDNNSVNLLLDSISNGTYSSETLQLEENNFIDYKDKKYLYHFIVNSNSHKKILSYFKSDKINVITIRFYYEVVNQLRYWFFPLFPIFLIIISLLNIFTNNNIQNLNLSGVILFLSFLTFYYSFVREGYEIPANRSLIASIPFSGLLLLFPVFVYQLIFSIF